MYTMIRTVWLSLAVLSSFLVLRVSRIYQDSICNADGPWGIPLPPEILIGVDAAAALLIFCWLLFFARGRNMLWGIPLLIGGLSNLFERISFGCIRDFIHTFSWFPVFNIADVLLTVAVIGLLWENKSESFK